MSWKAPNEAEILQVVDATWPAARYKDSGPFTLRLGLGGGQRVSAATANRPASAAEIDLAEQAMLAMGQAALFMITQKDSALDKTLESRGYYKKDPVTLFAAPIEAITAQPTKDDQIIPASAALAIIKETWEKSRFEAGRLAVMERTQAPKSYLVCRANDRVAGAAFVASHKGHAMLHALEILPENRRQGLGKAMTVAAARWGQNQGATTFSLLAVTANTAASALYRHLGMQAVGHYHYRKKET